MKLLVTQSCPTLCNPRDCSQTGFSVHGIRQVRILEWVAILFSRGSSWLRDRTGVSCIAGRLFSIWTTRETQNGRGLWQNPGETFYCSVVDQWKVKQWSGEWLLGVRWPWQHMAKCHQGRSVPWPDMLTITPIYVDRNDALKEIYALKEILCMYVCMNIGAIGVTLILKNNELKRTEMKQITRRL